MHWLIVLVTVMLVFGTQRLSNVGTDLGKAIKGFKGGIKGAEQGQEPSQQRSDSEHLT